MDEHDKLVAKLLTLVAICALAIPGGCVSYQSKLIAESSDPLATACAFGLDKDSCVAYAAKH